MQPAFFKQKYIFAIYPCLFVFINFFVWLHFNLSLLFDRYLGSPQFFTDRSNAEIYSNDFSMC